MIDKVYSQGDFTIISSDSKPVKFQLPSYYLLAARYVRYCLMLQINKLMKY
jgi:hypothetical protein